MDFDLVLEEIGEFGRYQQTNYMLLCLPVLFAAANSLAYVFTAGVPNYRCFIPECDNPIQSMYNEAWLPNAVPGSYNGFGTFVPEQCQAFARQNPLNDTHPLAVAAMVMDKDQLQCPAKWFAPDKQQATCTKWVFDKHERTIVNDWEITCPENEWMLATVGTIHFAGIVVGSGVFGVLADRYGRKLVFIFCIMFMSLTGIGQAVSQDYITFLVFAFLNAVGTSGVYPLAFIIGVEMVGAKKREMSGVILNYFYALGEAAVGLAAWASRDWVILQYAVSAPPMLFVLYYWLVPESVRWLLAKKDTDRAGKIIRKAARVNGVVLSDNIIQRFELKMKDKEMDDSTYKKELQKGEQKHEIAKTFKQLITSRIMIIRSLILCYIWAANAFVFYGLSLNSTSISGNKYLNFVLVCLIEIPGYSMAWVAMNKIGRRWSLAGSLLLSAITCVTGAFVTQDYTWLLIVLFLSGKMGVTSSFAVIYVHTAEMLPTTIRSGGVGFMSTVARIGALVAPFVPLLNRYYKPLPLMLFGSVSLIGGLLALLLPETLGEKLPDTIEEAERIGKKPEVVDVDPTSS